MIIYTLKSCDSCRKAVRWLKDHRIPHTEKPIREHPPTVAELKLALESAGGQLGKLFNTSGQDYRSMNLKEILPTLSEEETLALLASNGNLVKRPLLVSGSRAITGFSPVDWEKLLLP
jgi:arsenate reductase (glutaredoxin)